MTEQTRSRFPVSAEKEAALAQRLAELHVREVDLVEHFVRSSGPGGQKVNKTSSAVYLKHLPTGIEVKMQEARSQGMNRFLARRLLAERLAALITGERSAEQARLEKIRRQKRRRSRRSKARMLADKRVQSDKKRLRQPPRET